MQHAEIEWNQCCLVVQLRRNIVYLLSQDVIPERLVISLLNRPKITSDPPAIVLKICEDFSLSVEIFDAVHVSMSLIFTP